MLSPGSILDIKLQDDSKRLRDICSQAFILHVKCSPYDLIVNKSVITFISKDCFGIQMEFHAQWTNWIILTLLRAFFS